MSRLDTIEQAVEKILENKKDARESDDVLYVYICEYFCKGISGMSLKDFLFDRHKTICPTFESVSRTRRKIVSLRPELMPNEKIIRARKDMEMEFRDYALS